MTGPERAHEKGLRRRPQMRCRPAPGASGATRTRHRHQELLINGHLVEVTEDDVGIAELHEV